MEEIIKDKNEKMSQENQETKTPGVLEEDAGVKMTGTTGAAVDAEAGIEREIDEEELENPMKIEIGKRFRRFRESINKAQHELAAELNIYQSTITNIERGKTFPNIRYLIHFYKKYQLNINWLLTNDGDMLVYHYHTNPNAVSVMDCHIRYNDPKYMQYAELFNYMQVPEIEQVMLARLTETKALFRDQIAEFYAREAAKEQSEGI
jgi:transcriptional regulator with XRE-family HTH domain